MLQSSDEINLEIWCQASVSVLLCDSVPIVLEGLRASLAACPTIEVVGATSNGGEALKLVAQAHPDVLITDFALVGISGLEVVRRISGKRSAGSPTTRTLIFSSAVDDSSIIRALEAEVYGYITKDARREELIAAIHALAAGDAALSPAIARRVIDYLFWRNSRPLEHASAALRSLTAREREVLQLISQGLPTQEIAEMLCLGVSTVRTHTCSIQEKLGARDRAQLVCLAFRSGFASPTVSAFSGQ